MIERYQDEIIGYLLIGLCFLLLTLRGSMKNSGDLTLLQSQEIELGEIVWRSIFLWPYHLLCWIFSWPIWLMPVRDILLRIGILNHEMNPLYKFLIAVLLFLNLVFLWYFEVFRWQ
ncbi:hypothetical protein [Nitrosomonas marina]|uniref:Uncharacterized protein n=1 Tax=Nitrosomonas marina TaxID=917 RepID=A0A1H8IM92_9PROT|nr:hypothetical protein [Nitrosomonas marina]SEN69694.1 hypothetical protein SAMN05216325_1365 [Nitrosomonas marina]